jgi:methyl-accepting chemotaxis protein
MMEQATADARAVAPTQSSNHALAATPSRGLLGWFDDKPLKGKIRIVFGTFLALVLAVNLVLAFGLSELYGRYNTHSEVRNAVFATSELQTEATAMRYDGMRYVLAMEAETLERRQNSVKSARELMVTIKQGVDTGASELAQKEATIRDEFDQYNRTFESLRGKVERDGETSANTKLAYSLAEQGDTLLNSVDSFKRDLLAIDEDMQKTGLAFFFNMVFIVLFLSALAAIVMALGLRYISKNFANKVVEISDAMNQLTVNDRSFELDGAERKDEIGQMVLAVEQFREAGAEFEKMATERAERAEEKSRIQAEREQERLELKAKEDAILAALADRFEKTVGEVVSGVASASSQLQDTASNMAEKAEASTKQAAQVATSIEEANAGATSAAAASDEFAMSIGEISRQAASSAELARKATDSAKEADQTISALSDSAEQVGEVVSLIHTIAQRTNLLALNASIEAARGGEAGRGFAVVASEVKELAMQTSRATDQVSQQIEAMQNTTGASVNALRSIANQVEQLESTAVSIASAVDQQSVAGQDLARSIDLAARSSDSVSSHIEDVRELSLSTGSAASQVLSSSTDLEEQASALRDYADEFLKRIRAG